MVLALGACCSSTLPVRWQRGHSAGCGLTSPAVPRIIGADSLRRGKAAGRNNRVTTIAWAEQPWV